VVIECNSQHCFSCSFSIPSSTTPRHFHRYFFGLHELKEFRNQTFQEMEIGGNAAVTYPAGYEEEEDEDLSGALPQQEPEPAAQIDELPPSAAAAPASAETTNASAGPDIDQAPPSNGHDEALMETDAAPSGQDEPEGSSTIDPPPSTEASAEEEPAPVEPPLEEEEPAPVEAPPVVRSHRWEAEHVKRIETDIAANLYNTDAWLALINEANRHSSDMSFLREAYERFLKIFPTAVRFSTRYTNK
jgi:hypothetical protein